MENKKLFESILKENYKADPADIEKFKKISVDAIQERLDCTILSGPHSDKTGPCYCIDDHDHEIKILYMQEVLEAFAANAGETIHTVVLMTTEACNYNWPEINKCKGNIYYGSKSGDQCLIINTDLNGAQNLVDACIDIQDENYDYECFVMAVSSELEQKLNYGGFGYDVTDIEYEIIDIPMNNEITIPKEICDDNAFAMKAVGVTSSTVYDKIKMYAAH